MKKEIAERIRRLRLDGFTYRKIAWIETGDEIQAHGMDLCHEVEVALGLEPNQLESEVYQREWQKQEWLKFFPAEAVDKLMESYSPTHREESERDQLRARVKELEAENDRLLTKERADSYWIKDLLDREKLLKAENERLRVALKTLADYVSTERFDGPHFYPRLWAEVAKARAALREEGGGRC